MKDDPMFLDEATGTRLHYIDAAWFAPHAVSLQRTRATGELPCLFGVIERLHTDGDAYVRELTTIGYLEGIQIACSHTSDVRQEEFETLPRPRVAPAVARAQRILVRQGPHSPGTRRRLRP